MKLIPRLNLVVRCEGLLPAPSSMPYDPSRLGLRRVWTYFTRSDGISLESIQLQNQPFVHFSHFLNLSILRCN